MDVIGVVAQERQLMELWRKVALTAASMLMTPNIAQHSLPTSVYETVDDCLNIVQNPNSVSSRSKIAILPVFLINLTKAENSKHAHAQHAMSQASLKYLATYSHAHQDFVTGYLTLSLIV